MNSAAAQVDGWGYSNSGRPWLTHGGLAPSPDISASCSFGVMSPFAGAMSPMPFQSGAMSPGCMTPMSYGCGGMSPMGTFAIVGQQPCGMQQFPPPLPSRQVSQAALTGQCASGSAPSHTRSLVPPAKVAKTNEGCQEEFSPTLALTEDELDFDFQPPPNMSTSVQASRPQRVKGQQKERPKKKRSVADTESAAARLLRSLDTAKVDTQTRAAASGGMGGSATGGVVSAVVTHVGDYNAAPITPQAPITTQAIDAVDNAAAPITHQAIDAVDNDFDFGFDEPPSIPPVESVTADTIADFLRTQKLDSATYRVIGLHFRASEAVRRVVQETPAYFLVVGDVVTLKDWRRKEALKCLAKELNRKVFMRKSIVPETVKDPLMKAAALALQSYPDDVSKLLQEVSKMILKKSGMVAKGFYSMGMPVPLACLFDRIVRLERAQSGDRRFENALSPIVHKTIFRRWTIGVLPGSQFLANLLLTWKRLGYFKVKHLEEPMKSLWLLVAFAGPDGVPDPPHKDQGTGWYQLVRRSAEGGVPLSAAEAEACRALGSAKVEPPAQADADRRERVLKAAAQMNLA